jgi:hypothetical protein
MKEEIQHDIYSDIQDKLKTCETIKERYKKLTDSPHYSCKMMTLAITIS